MDWVHCNNCFVQPGDVENKKFFITNCGHIYCDECQQMNKSNECRICHVQYNVIPLSSNMSSEVELYFHDPVISLKKQMKVLEFQHSHRVRLVSHNREKIRSYKAVKKENYNLCEELKLYKKENAILREEIKRLKKDFQEYKKRYDQSLSAKCVRTHSFSQFMNKDTPETSPNLLLKKTASREGNFSGSLKRPNSNFFLMTESKPSVKNEVNFTTPDLPRFPAIYRGYKTSTPDMSTPPTPETFFRECSQKDLLHRRVKLPSGPSPATKIGFHGLSLSRPTSATKKDNTHTSKYPKYFK